MRPAVLPVIVAAFALSFFCSPAASQTWQAIGPWGGSVSSLALDPSQPSRVFVGLAANGVWRSDDAGESWTWAGGTSLRDVSVQTLAVDPFDPAHLLAGPQTSAALWQSSDGGASWSSVSVGSGWAQAREIVFDPLVPGRILFLARRGADPGVFRSTDGGASWAHADAGVTSLADPGDVVFHPTVAGVAVLGTGSGLWRTTDAGSSWSLVLAGGSSWVPPGLAWSPSDPSRVYAAGVGSTTYLAKSTDAGLTWTDLTAVCSMSCFPHDLAVDPTNPDRVYLGWTGYDCGGSCGGVSFLHVSTNAGASWSWRFSGSSPWWEDQTPRAIVVDPTDPQRVWLALANGLTDGADGWSPDGLRRSDDAGTTWTVKMAGLPGGVVVAVDAQGGDAYARTDGLWHSTAVGSWTSRPVPPVYAQLVSPRSFLVNPSSGVLHESDFAFDYDIGWRVQSSSTDHGQTWTSWDDNSMLNGFEDVAVSPDDQTLYGWDVNRYPCCPDADFYRSTNGGATFLEVATVPRPVATVVDPADVARIWTLAELTGEVRYSSDSGETWELRSMGLPADPGVELLAGPPWTGRDDPVLIAVFRNADAFISSDGAKTWSGHTPAPGVPVVAAEWDPARDHLFLATESSGIWSSHHGFMNVGLTTRAFTSLCWWEMQQRLLAGTDRSSVFAVLFSSVETPDVAPAPAGILAFPNPFGENTSIRFSLRAPQQAELVIHDVTGRFVRRLSAGYFAAGARSVTWDGRDDGGRPVSAGIYFARLRAGEEPGRTVRLVRLR